jgi:hypothetical protein
MWRYECESGSYAHDSLSKLLWLIFTHRLHHLVEHGKFMD